jgi:predicted regulator of Ras-like GTPase activity (Roadblock/LC7/MglB family)
VELTRGKMILVSAGPRALVVVTASNEVPLAELVSNVKRLAAKISEKI